MSKTYTTVQGDTWDGVAYKILGDEKYLTALMNLNFNCRNFVIFPSGIELKLPEIEVSTDSYKEKLPPWKR